MSRRVSGGQRVGKQSANEFNSWQDAADAFKQTKHGNPTSIPGTSSEYRILVKNTSGADRPRFSILGINGFVLDPGTSSQLLQFQSQVAFTVVNPIARGSEGGGEVHTEDGFVVLAEPIKQNKFGFAWVYGVCPVQINIVHASHRFAKIRDDDPTKLDSVGNGPIVILWKETGTGTKWAVIRFGGSSTTSTRMRVKVVKKNYLECVSWDGTTEGTTTITVAKPYLFRSTITSYDGDVFSSYSTDGQEKIASNGGIVETWRLNPRYVADCEIWAELGPNGGTGVVDDASAAVQWIDTNKDGREWAKLNSTPPALAEGGTASPDDLFWIQGAGFLECPGAEIACDAVVQDSGMLENAGAELVCVAYASAISPASAISGPGAQVSGSGIASALAAPAMSGPGAQVAATVIAAAVGSGALSGPGAVTKGYLA